MHDSAGDPVDDRFVGAAAVPRDLRHCARGRLEEHDAEPLLLETGPTIAAQHRKDVGGAVHRGEVVIGDSAEELDRGTLLGRDTLEPRPIAPSPGDGDLQIRARRAQP